MKRKMLALSLCFLMLFGTTLTAYATAPDKMPCTHCNTQNEQILSFAQEQMGLNAELLDTNAASPYIEVLSNFKGIKDFDTKSTILKVVKVTPLNFIYITAMNENNPNKVLFSVIDGEQNTISAVVLSDIAENGNIQISAYDSNGTLKTYQKTQAELDELVKQKEAVMLEYINNQNSSDSLQPKISIPSNWLWWACQFGSWLACSTGCGMFIEIPPAYIACTAACRTAFTTLACDDLN